MRGTRTTGQSKWALTATLPAPGIQETGCPAAGLCHVWSYDCPQHMQMLVCKSCHLYIVSEGRSPACLHSRTQHVLTSNSVDLVISFD